MWKSLAQFTHQFNNYKMPTKYQVTVKVPETTWDAKNKVVEQKKIHFPVNET